MENKKLFDKLLEAQKKIGAVTKDKKNPFFKSNYADINAYIENVKPVLCEVGIVLLQPLTNIEGEPAIKTILMSGDEKIEDIVILPKNPDPQKMGSTITYFRRYALQSLLFLQAEDDDANKSSGNNIEKVGGRKVIGNKEVPTCECGKLMKPTKEGSRVPFFCKHDDGTWGKAKPFEKEVAPNTPDGQPF